MKGIVGRSLAPAGIQTQATTAAVIFVQSQAPCPFESGVPAADVNPTYMTSIQIRMTAVARNTKARYADVASRKSLVIFGMSSLTELVASVQH